MNYYLLIVFISLVFALLTNEKNKKYWIAIIMILLSLLSGLRHYSIGNDTYNYYRNFFSIAYYGFDFLKTSRFEIGYSFIVYIVTLLTNNFNVFLLLTSLLVNIAIGTFIYKYSKNPMFSIILFIFLRLFFSEMNILREFLSLTIFLFSIKYIENRNLFKYTILLFIGYLIHNSIIFAFPIYFLYDVKLNSNKKRVAIILTAIVYLFLYRIVTYIANILGIYSNYIDKYYNSNKLGSILSLAVSLTIYLFCWYISKKYITKKPDEMEKKRHDFYNNISFILLMINVLVVKISVLSRIELYYEIFYLLLIPNTINAIKESKKRLIWYIIIFLSFFLYFILITYLRPNWNMVIPYRFFWQ